MRRLWCCMTALAVIWLATPSAAQAPPDDAAKGAARGLALTGKQRFDAGDYSGAIEALRDAEKYYPAPTIRSLRARSHEKLGQLLEARDLYALIAGQQLDAGASREFQAAHEEAKNSLGSLEKRIPRVDVTLAHAPAGTRVTLDGKVLDSAALAQPLRLNPGKYTIVVEPPGKAKVTRALDLKEGATEKVEVDLAPRPPQPTTTTPVVPPLASTVGPVAAPSDTGGAVVSEPGTGRSIVGPAIAFGVGGAGLIVGAVTGGITFANAAEVRELCGGDLTCNKGQESEVNLEGRKGIGYVSTAAFVVAGAGALVGTLLLVLSGGKKNEPAKAALSVGPGFITVKGAF